MSNGTYADLASRLRSELSASTYERLETVLIRASGDSGKGHLAQLMGSLDQVRDADLDWEEADRQDREADQ